jgi:hypothetical protein
MPKQSSITNLELTKSDIKRKKTVIEHTQVG